MGLSFSVFFFCSESEPYFVAAKPTHTIANLILTTFVRIVISKHQTLTWSKLVFEFRQKA